jgi:YVTN family beta-propeller protein
MKLAIAKFAAAILVCLCAAIVVVSQPAPPERVGPLPGGGFLLNSGWRIQPAGKQIPLDTFPMSTALSPNGKYLLILNGGYNPPTVTVHDVATGNEISRTRVADGWLGLTFSRDGRNVYVGGGSQASVFEFNFNAGQLTAARTFVVVPQTERTHQDFVGDVAFSPDGRLLYATVLYRDTVVVINPQSGRVIEKIATGRRPYRILFHPDGKSFFVSSWADGTVYHHEAETGNRLGFIRLGPHTTDMAWSDRKPGEADEAPQWKTRLFVTAGNTNRVFVVGVSDSKELKQVETINVAMTPQQPAGMTPSAVALNRDQTRLFVVCSDANAVAVADISEPRSNVLGFIPTGWYPTTARALPDGRLVVLNGRGLRSYANPKGPNVTKQTARSHEGIRQDEYVGTIQRGTASIIDPFTDEQLAAYTKTVMANSPYRDSVLLDAHTGPNNPIPSKPGDPSPIEHVVYIVKENRTYDQVFGGLGKGNGDPSLALFDETSAPNHFKLAREFVLFDNFYVNADVSADGHSWTLAAIAPDYVQRLWPNSYALRRRHYDYEGSDPAATPPAGYIWSQVAAAGLTLRNYGYFANNTPQPATDGDQVLSLRDPVLSQVTNRKYRAFDLNYPDVERAKTFLKDVAEFEQKGAMPRFLIMRLGNDHTSGTAAGKIAPLAAFADNDAALGMVVEGLSKSRFWPKMAIFVLEDDAQAGPDHVDSHRSPAFVLSPYTRRGVIDSSMYNTTSMLRTIELILGLRPMTHFDAAARPMSAAFSTPSNPQPYIAEKPRRSLEERNPETSATAARSARLDFSDADQIDDEELNDILWRAIRKTEPPPPTRSIFAK